MWWIWLLQFIVCFVLGNATTVPSICGVFLKVTITVWAKNFQSFIVNNALLKYHILIGKQNLNVIYIAISIKSSHNFCSVNKARGMFFFHLVYTGKYSLRYFTYKLTMKAVKQSLVLVTTHFVFTRVFFSAICH